MADQFDRLVINEESDINLDDDKFLQVVAASIKKKKASLPQESPSQHQKVFLNEFICLVQNRDHASAQSAVPLVPATVQSRTDVHGNVHRSFPNREEALKAVQQGWTEFTPCRADHQCSVPISKLPLAPRSNSSREKRSPFRHIVQRFASTLRSS